MRELQFVFTLRWNLNHQTSINIDVGRELCHWIDRYTASISTLKQKKNIKQKKKSPLVPSTFFSRSTFVECEQIGLESFSMEIIPPGLPLIQRSKKSYTRDSFLFDNIRFIRFPMSLFPRNWKIYARPLPSFCLSRSLLEQDFFRRVKRFTSAIDVALDTRSLIRGK